MSKIEWTDTTWNPVAGCTVLSRGCTNCYAMRMAARLERMGQRKYENTTRVSGGRAKWTGRINLDYQALKSPYGWSKPRMIFVNSMSDLFHENVPTSFVEKVFSVISDNKRHIFQILTKRPERMLAFSHANSIPPNAWLGTSVEDRETLGRLDTLKAVVADVRFVSFEPLLEDLGEISLDGIAWAIVGGESGPGSRRIDIEWVRSIRETCEAFGTAFHFKQWGGPNKKASGRELDGRTWDQFPEPVIA